jgi:hypothetical protein
MSMGLLVDSPNLPDWHPVVEFSCHHLLTVELFLLLLMLLVADMTILCRLVTWRGGCAVTKAFLSPV